ncbi:TetR/AcrR family transcriptional regulator [Streptomyces apricus]|uniref:TetR/AcrR family transcriptional regulator n=1 Tax=Streptomyces apricus TaxID=1828112 RepID=A0A5B0BDH1_9ACTN|nr:TetR/AcrR family transcriptional regulator [Streptomyces apricus]KAA0940164.1 TetR/AcrR family transcriptional regulator [Streptomyces apricus]
MTADRDATAPPTLRQRRWAAAAREILEAAERQIAEDGPAALSLRAVSRSLGMTVQALYHYFPSRDDLVTALIAKAYDALAEAVRAAVDAAGDDSPVERVVLATEGYRSWAIAHPELFQLLYGTPLRYYAAPVDGPTTQAMRRMSTIFERELFGRFTEAQLAAAQTPDLSPSFTQYLDHLPSADGRRLPSAATALLMSAWGHMHGMVVLEVFGHTSFLGDHQAEVFRMSMRNLVEDVHRRIAPAGDGTAGAASATG